MPYPTNGDVAFNSWIYEVKEREIKELDIQISWHWRRPLESGVRRDLIKYGGLIVKYGRSIYEDFCGLKFKSLS